MSLPHLLLVDDSEAVQTIRRAREQGIGPSTLARMWILERLQQAAP